MRCGFNIQPLMFFLLITFFFLQLDANAQTTYLPEGPQVNVPVSTVANGGWTECYMDTYENFMNAEEVLAQCPGDLLMLSCRETGSDTLMLLAQAPREDVTFDTGESASVTHISNGVGWYFNISGIGEDAQGQNAWGFARAGDTVDKGNCDTDNSGENDERLCWHLQRTVGGFRCGTVIGLNVGPPSAAYERIVYTAASPPAPPSTPASIPTLSEWGLITMAGVIGVVGLLAIRRRKVIE